MVLLGKGQQVEVSEALARNSGMSSNHEWTASKEVRHEEELGNQEKKDEQVEGGDAKEQLGVRR